MPVTKDFKMEARKKGVTLILLQTKEAARHFSDHYGPRTNAVFILLVEQKNEVLAAIVRMAH
jgi:hypothetical protein